MIELLKKAADGKVEVNGLDKASMLSNMLPKRKVIVMNKPVIARYISDKKVFEETICKDFKFLVDKIKDSGFEYSLEIREDYFNLYYQGNSIGKIVYRSSKNDYEVSINTKFTVGKKRGRSNPLAVPSAPSNASIPDFDALDDITRNRLRVTGRIRRRSVGKSEIFVIPPNKLPAFFSKVNLGYLSQMVKDENYQEEIGFEQMLMTDNVGRSDFVIIDRQVVEHSGREKIDLLGLKRVDGDNFQFCVLEVKLGNNKELKGDVRGQLQRYAARIEKHFDDYKKCYQRNFEQKKKLRLIDNIEKINIVPGVLRIVVVGGHGGLAKQSIKELRSKDKDIHVLHITNEIKFDEVKPKCN